MEVLGLNSIDWMSFDIDWAFHNFIFWHRMDWVETFLNIAGPFVYAVMIGGFWTSFISQFGVSGFVNTLGATLAPPGSTGLILRHRIFGALSHL